MNPLTRAATRKNHDTAIAIGCGIALGILAGLFI